MTVQGSGDNAAIIVSVPGSVEQDRLVELVGRTAQLSFRAVEAATGPEAVDPNAPIDEPSAEPTPTEAQPSPTATDGAEAEPSASPEQPVASEEPSASASPTPTPAVEQPEIPVQAAANDTEFQDRALRLDCTLPENRSGSPDDPELWLATCDRDGVVKYLLQPVFIKGTSVTSATAQLDPTTNGWSVSLEFDAEGGRALAEISTEIWQKDSPQNRFGIVLDGLVVSAPSVANPIPGGSAEITGNFTQEEATALANVLKYGALPVTFQVASVDTVSPDARPGPADRRPARRWTGSAARRRLPADLLPRPGNRGGRLAAGCRRRHVRHLRGARSPARARTESGRCGRRDRGDRYHR